MELQIKVAQAVHALNHDSQSRNRVAANQWLVQFQQTDLAWDVAISILTSDHHRHHHLVLHSLLTISALNLLFRTEIQ